MEGSQLWYKPHRLLRSGGVWDTLGVTRLRLVTPWVYPIHHSFLGVYLSNLTYFPFINIMPSYLCPGTSDRKVMWYYTTVLFFRQFSIVQCRHLIPALNAWATRAKYTTACPIATLSQSWMHECMDDLTTERGVDLQATWVIDVLDSVFFTCYIWVIAQPGTSRRLVDWCRNYMSVL